MLFGNSLKSQKHNKLFWGIINLLLLRYLNRYVYDPTSYQNISNSYLLCYLITLYLIIMQFYHIRYPIQLALQLGLLGFLCINSLEVSLSLKLSLLFIVLSYPLYMVVSIYYHCSYLSSLYNIYHYFYNYYLFINLIDKFINRYKVSLVLYIYGILSYYYFIL